MYRKQQKPQFFRHKVIFLVTKYTDAEKAHTPSFPSQWKPTLESSGSWQWCCLRQLTKYFRALSSEIKHSSWERAGYSNKEQTIERDNAGPLAHFSHQPVVKTWCTLARRYQLLIDDEGKYMRYVCTAWRILECFRQTTNITPCSKSDWVKKGAGHLPKLLLSRVSTIYIDGLWDDSRVKWYKNFLNRLVMILVGICFFLQLKSVE